jgi:hypothetical protein
MLIIFFRLKKKFKIALEENPLVIPGKDLRETYTFFIGKDCYNELLSQERDQVYEEPVVKKLGQKKKIPLYSLTLTTLIFSV